MVEVTRTFHEAAEHAADIIERTNPDDADPAQSQSGARYWRSASTWALRVATEWESGPPLDVASDPPPITSPAPSVIDLTTTSRARVDRAATRLAATVVSTLWAGNVELRAAASLTHDPTVKRRLANAAAAIDCCIGEIDQAVAELRA